VMFIIRKRRGLGVNWKNYIDLFILLVLKNYQNFLFYNMLYSFLAGICLVIFYKGFHCSHADSYEKF
jgi:hypothetical protein